MTDQPRCRFCGAVLRHTVVDLGTTPLANAYVRFEDLDIAERSYPLHVRVCAECLLVQVEETVSPEELFSEYAYFSSYSSSWLHHAEELAMQTIERLGLDARSLVLEIASNDGYLLRHFRDRGIGVLGVEPAANVAAAAQQTGIPTEVAFFGREYAAELRSRGVAPDLILGLNVLAHVPDINGFVAGLGMLAGEQGIIVVEFPHLLELITGFQFDTIYHEHFSYLSLLSVERMFASHGLRVFDVQQLPTHGGSLRVFARRAGTTVVESESVGRIRALERRAALADLATYGQFASGVEKAQQGLRDFLLSARTQGATVAAYGAAAKGNTLLNTCGITGDLISYVVDRSPHKQGRFLPGSRLEIFPPDHVFETRPDYLLILPWNLAGEIMDQMAGVRSWGGRFVTPIPEVRVLP